MKKILYILWFFAIITLGWCTTKSNEVVRFDLPERNMSFEYPKTYTVTRDPYNNPAGSVWIEKGTWDDGASFDFERWSCFPEAARTGWETTINGNKFFLKQEWEKTAYEKSLPKDFVWASTGEAYYYYEDYPKTDGCISFTVNSSDSEGKTILKNIIHSIKFIK